MFRWITATLILALSVSYSYGNEIMPITASSAIDAVTVFTDRAMIKRIFSSDFPKGKVVVKIPDLPSGLLNESVRVSGMGTAGARISSVWVENEYSEKTMSEKADSLNTELENLTKKENELRDRSDVLSRKKIFIENLSTKTFDIVSKGENTRIPTTAEWAEMLALIERQLDGINLEKRTIEEEKTEIREKKEIINGKIRQLGEASANSSKTAVVELMIERPGYFEFNLAYIVRGATWKPVYYIRASSEKDTIDMLMFAEITQNTGENWDNVNLELSTARPNISAKPPEPRPWFIGFQSDIGRYGARGGRDEEIGLMKDGFSTSMEIDDHPPVTNESDVLRTTSGFVTQRFDTQWAISSVTEQLISTSFALAQRASVQGNNTPKKVSIKAVELAGDMEYFTFPRQEAYAYLKSEFVNKTNFPFLAGAASVFLDGNFVHSTIIPLVVPDEKFDLYLGIDDKIKIDRELVEKFTDVSGILSSKQKVSYSFNITVENFRKTAQKITVFEQIPVSQNEQIEVKLPRISPRNISDELDKSKGYLRWKFELKPNKKEEITYTYEIKYPESYQITGLQ